MDVVPNEAESTIICAAGGLIWKDRGRKLALIRRTKDGEEWTLPQRELHIGASWSCSALLDIMKEETGCEIILGKFGGCYADVTKGRHKVMLFWNMDWVRDLTEVVDICWCTVPEASRRLKNPVEKRVVTDKEAIVGHGWSFAPAQKTGLKSWWRKFWLSASARRLTELLSPYPIELDHLIGLAKDKNVDLSWTEPAKSLLSEASEALKECDEDRGWHCFLAAQRMELRGLKQVNEEAFQIRCKTIHQEALDKLRSWRKERVVGLLGNVVVESQLPAKGSLAQSAAGTGSPGSPSPNQRTVSLEAICEVAQLLHSHFDNDGVKRRAGRKQMQLLVGVALVVVTVWLVFLFRWPELQSELHEEPRVGSAPLMVSVILFGLMGASLSGILSTSSDPAKIRIPDLLFSFRVTLARLVVGVLSAVAASVMFMSEFLKIGDLKLSSSGILLVALAAGFSERLVVSALSKVTGDKG